jgi:hypothetical protein
MTSYQPDILCADSTARRETAMASSRIPAKPCLRIAVIAAFMKSGLL